MIKNIFVDYWKRMIFGAVVGIALYVAYLSIQQAWGYLLFHVDALFAAFALVFCFGLMSTVTNLGAFDIFSYQFGRRRLESGRREDLYEYTKRKKEERRKDNLAFLAYFFVSIPFLIGFIVCYIILRCL